MRYLALATDYDGTIAHHGRLDEPTIAALTRLRDSGRKLLLVTGRELDELLEVCPRIDLFDRVVAENGALIYRPATKEERLLGEPPPEAFVAGLKARGAERVSVGRSIVATWEPHQTTALDLIKELGLELQVIFNKGAVMILPSGVNKATGLAAALEELRLSAHNVVGVGDAENDHAFLALCEAGVAVANALDAVKERADLTTRADHGAGVAELIDLILADDLAALEPKLDRHGIPLGTAGDGAEVRVPPYGRNLLVAGSSGSGKSTVTSGLLERLGDQGYQFAIIDPEGDYSAFEGSVALGDPQRVPTVEEVLEVLATPSQNVSVNLLGIALEHRPAFFQELLPRLQELRARAGRPHWVVVDEAHHLLPKAWAPAGLTIPRDMRGMLFITVHPESMAPAILGSIDTVLAVGQAPDETIGRLCGAIGRPAPPRVGPEDLESGRVLAWSLAEGAAPVEVASIPPRGERRRHSRKYAEGSVGPDRSFRFRGPEGKLNLAAQNLVIFLQMADGVDAATWAHHLAQGDYSAWFAEGLKDPDLAAEARAIEQAGGPPDATRAAIRKAIEGRYTLPAEGPSGLIESAQPGPAR